ncbi:MAG: hypothetical protein ABIH63_02520 [archaeon]
MADSAILQGFQDITDFILVTQGVTETALIKFSLWLFLFFIIFKGAEKVFKEGRAIPMLVAAIISFIGIRFMPEEWINAMTTVYAIVVGIALFIGPYILISIISDAARLGRTIKWILILIAYGALIYFLPSFGALTFGSEILDGILRYFADNRFIAAAAFLVVLILLIMARRKIYRGAAWGAGTGVRGVGWGLRGVGRAGVGAVRYTGRGIASGARYLGEGAAFGAGAAAGYGRARGGGMVSNMWARMQANRRRKRIAKRMMRAAAARRAAGRP